MTYADRIPAPRPVPTTRQRLTDARTCDHTPEQHRHTDGQAADARSKDRAMREALDERDTARTTVVRREERIAGLVAENRRLTRDLDSTRQTATFRQGVIDLHAAELGAAGEVLAVVRDATEQIERALARYDTAPEVTPVITTTCTCDSPASHEHRPWCATQHQHPGPDCPGLCEPASAPLGSVSPHAQDDDLEPWLRRAAADPGGIAGRRRGPSWPKDEEGYAEEQETVPAWIARAVLRVLAKDGQPHCERCSQVIQVNDLYDPPLPGVGLWEHRGACPTVAARSGCDDCSVEPGERHRYVGCPSNLRATGQFTIDTRTA